MEHTPINRILSDIFLPRIEASPAVALRVTKVFGARRRFVFVGAWMYSLKGVWTENHLPPDICQQPEGSSLSPFVIENLVVNAPIIQLTGKYIKVLFG